MLLGLNHLTLAVTDLSRSIAFYQSLPGSKLKARWATGAYLALGELWLCLSLDEKRQKERQPDNTHYAISVAQDDFAVTCAQLRSLGIVEWKANVSEGDSFYFLDPDGHRLELHVGSLASRLEKCRLEPYRDMEFFD
ncbi:VOC family protein [Pseudomonas sp. SCB32]|uniref:VOC family protein n=1 Tax=Pseudomonas sp. SCB32 TaxID=2653853 RepID=UPI001264C978|nr:VOC family protein [Pseudomonas sp. SCB32]